MAKKRKSVATRLDEADRTIYSTFCSAANSLSQLYTQAMNQQKITFQAGERHGMEKVNNWIFRQEEEGMRVSVADILAFLQNELDYGGDDSQHQHSQPNMHFINSASQGSSVLFGQAQPAHGLWGLVTLIKPRTLFSQMLFPVRLAGASSLVISPRVKGSIPTLHYPQEPELGIRKQTGTPVPLVKMTIPLVPTTHIYGHPLRQPSSILLLLIREICVAKHYPSVTQSDCRRLVCW